MSITLDTIKELRQRTGSGVMDAKKALEESGGDMKKAEEWIRQKGIQRAEKKTDRETAQGMICTYVHHNGKSGALVKLLCETDFVAKTDEFQKLGRELAMQAVSMTPESVEALLEQDYMREPSKKIGDLVKEVAGKLGENVQIGGFEVLSI